MKTEEPLLSIVCATHNRSRLLNRAIRSVLNQTIDDFELVVVNDGSTDETRKIVQSFNDPRIVYIEHSENKGLNAARNTGFAASKGRLLSLLDDDDELVNTALQIAIDTFQKFASETLKLFFFDIRDVESNAFSGIHFDEPKIVRFNDLLCQKLRGDYWIVVERSIIPKNEVFNEKAAGGASTFWLKLLRSYDAYYVPKVTYYAYRKHGQLRLSKLDASSKSWKMHENYTSDLLKEFGNDMKTICPNIYSKEKTILAFYKLMNGNVNGARSDLILAIRKNFSFYTLGLIFITLFRSRMISFMIYKRLEKFLSRSY